MKILVQIFLFCTLLLGPFVANAQSKTPVLVVYFESDSWQILPQEKAKIDSFIQVLEQIGAPNSFWIDAHTDADGSEAYNEILAGKRGGAVAKVLPDLPFYIYLYGESKPIKSNDIESNKRWNRRVEITADYTPKTNVTHINKILDSLITYQYFCIDPNKDTVLIGADGTILNIQAHSFLVQANSTTCLKIRLREFLSIEDMLMARMNTVSNGQLLESGGMIYIDAVDTLGNQVDLKKGASINISVPTNNPVPGMSVFYGDPDQSGHMNWNSPHDSGSHIIMDDFYDQSIRTFSPNSLMDGICDKTDEAVRCPFFFCRIRYFFRSIVNKNATPFNSGLPYSNLDCEKMKDSLFKAYGVTNYIDYMLAVNKDLMDSLTINSYDQLQSYFAAKEKERQLQRLQNGDASNYELTYYAFNASRLGYINCDRFSNLNNRTMVDLSLQLNNPEEYAVSIVFPKIKSILDNSIIQDKRHIVFQNIPSGTEIELVILKHIGNGKVKLCIKRVNTNDGTIGDFEFERVTVDELPERLAGL